MSAAVPSPSSMGMLNFHVDKSKFSEGALSGSKLPVVGVACCTAAAYVILRVLES